MKNFPTTITTENFNDAQQFVLKALTKVKRKALLQKLVNPIGSILFLFLSLLLVYGAVFSLSDALGMDNYARHCLINGNRSDAIYWLQKSIDTGEADYTSRELLAALKSGQHIDVHYN